MPLQTEVITSFGTFSCSISELYEDNRPIYQCEVMRQNSEARKAYNIYHAIFRMKYENGNLVPVRHAKSGPVPDYWEEMYAKVKAVILANN